MLRRNKECILETKRGAIWKILEKVCMHETSLGILCKYKPLTLLQNIPSKALSFVKTSYINITYISIYYTNTMALSQGSWVSSKCLYIVALHTNKGFSHLRLGIYNHKWFLHWLQYPSWNISQFSWHFLTWLSWHNNLAEERKKKKNKISWNPIPLYNKLGF